MSNKPDTNRAAAAEGATPAQPVAATAGNAPTQPLAMEGAPLAGMTAAPARRPVCAVRFGRGRLGGSMGMDLYIQRARFHGRRVKPLDGDLRSRTLSTLYPAQAADGSPIQDGASMPRSEETADYKQWLIPEFEQMVVEGVSRVIDLGGGERVMQEFVRVFPLSSYCEDFEVDLLPIFFLGPDIEDLSHVVQIMRTGALRSSRILLVMNEGVIRSGETSEGAFDPIVAHPDFEALVKGGAKSVFLRKLHCLDLLRARRFGFYDAAYGRPDPNGEKAGPALQFMTKIWLEDHEGEHLTIGSAGWLP